MGVERKRNWKRNQSRSKGTKKTRSSWTGRSNTKKEKKNEGQKSSRMETERCPLDLATGRSKGKWQGEETRLEWVAKE